MLLEMFQVAGYPPSDGAQVVRRDMTPSEQTLGVILSAAIDAVQRNGHDQETIREIGFTAAPVGGVNVSGRVQVRAALRSYSVPLLVEP